MFIYSYYTHRGFESPQKLVKAISRKNIREICLIDDKGMAIPSFLHSCMQEGINVSFAIIFSSFVEGYEQKQEGYFITGNKNGLEHVIKKVEELKENWIPFLNKNEMVEMESKAIFCYVKEGKEYRNLTNDQYMEIRPAYFLRDEDKNFHASVYNTDETYTVDEVCDRGNDLIKEISTKASDFLIYSRDSEQEIDIESIVKWDLYTKSEKRRIRREIEYFRQKNELIPIYSLYCAKEQTIPFVAHGDLYRSMLAYSLGIISEKPDSCSLDFPFDKEFECSIVIEEKTQNELFLLLKSTLKVKYPLTRYALKAKKALEKAEEILKEKSMISTKLREKETLEELEKRMRVFLLTNEKERKVFEFANMLTRIREEKCTLKKNYLLFVPETTHFVKGEEVVYVDIESLKFLSIPTIKCFYPPKGIGINEVDEQYKKKKLP